MKKVIIYAPDNSTVRYKIGADNVRDIKAYNVRDIKAYYKEQSVEIIFDDDTVAYFCGMPFEFIVFKKEKEEDPLF